MGSQGDPGNQEKHRRIKERNRHLIVRIRSVIEGLHPENKLLMQLLPIVGRRRMAFERHRARAPET